VKRTQFVEAYVFGTQRLTVESAKPATKLPSLDTTDVRAQTSEAWAWTQHLSLKSDITSPQSYNTVVNARLEKPIRYLSSGKTHS